MLSCSDVGGVLAVTAEGNAKIMMIAMRMMISIIDLNDNHDKNKDTNDDSDSSKSACALDFRDRAAYEVEYVCTTSHEKKQLANGLCVRVLTDSSDADRQHPFVCAEEPQKTPHKRTTEHTNTTQNVTRGILNMVN